MKTRVTITLMLAFISSLSVITAATTARQAALDHTLYLPFVSKPPCTFTKPEVYSSASKPVVRVGEVVTVTGALINDCAPLSHIAYYLETQPEGFLYPSHTMQYGDPPSISNGSYQEMTFTVQAVAAGVVTVSVSAGFLLNDPQGWWSGAVASPVIMRVLP